MTEKAFEYCKPEDWADFLTSYPEAHTFLRERALYREYIDLRLRIADDPGNKPAVKRLMDVVDEIVGEPYRKPQPANAHQQTATPPHTPKEVAFDDVKFFSSLSSEERNLILNAARDRFRLIAYGDESDHLAELSDEEAASWANALNRYTHVPYQPEKATPAPTDTPPTSILDSGTHKAGYVPSYETEPQQPPPHITPIIYNPPEDIKFFSSLPENFRAIILEAAWQAIRHELPVSPCIDPIDLGMTEEMLRMVYAPLCVFLGIAQKED